MSATSGGDIIKHGAPEKLESSKASVSLAISKPEKKKLVRKDEWRQVFLTPEGERHALMMLDKCMLIQDFLTEVLTVDKEIRLRP